MSQCCHEDKTPLDEKTEEALCHPVGKKKKRDYLLWISFIIVSFSYVSHVFFSVITKNVPLLVTFSESVFQMVNKMWWGVLIGIFFVGLLDKIPRNIVMSFLASDKKIQGVFRATVAGLFFDLCSHGILMVGMKLYERGANLGQVMAFLIASPWNSVSLTIILFSLIGIKLTVLFILFSALIAIISGIIFDLLVDKKILPSNPNRSEIPKDYSLKKELKEVFSISYSNITPRSVLDFVKQGWIESEMVLRWLLFGIILAGLLRIFLDPHQFQTYFGPTALGMVLTLLFATILEVCSEGSVPIAADIVTRAHAPGNGFIFLMSGVSTDYTEIMSLKGTTRSWRIALFLPLVTLPQVILVGLIIKYFY